MKKMLCVVLTIFCSCKDPEPALFVEYDFVVKEKVKLDSKYYLKSTRDSVMKFSPEDYIRWDVGDTIPMKMRLNGFLRGEHYYNF